SIGGACYRRLAMGFSRFCVFEGLMGFFFDAIFSFFCAHFFFHFVRCKTWSFSWGDRSRGVFSRCVAWTRWIRRRKGYSESSRPSRFSRISARFAFIGRRLRTECNCVLLLANLVWDSTEGDASKRHRSPSHLGIDCLVCPVTQA